MVWVLVFSASSLSFYATKHVSGSGPKGLPQLPAFRYAPEGPSRGCTSRPPFLASREVALSLDALWQEDAGPRSEAPVHTSPLGTSALESS